MRVISIELDVTDESYIYLHRRLKQFFDEVSPWYQIKSFHFRDEATLKGAGREQPDSEECTVSKHRLFPAPKPKYCGE
jgi:hypothetical protein